MAAEQADFAASGETNPAAHAVEITPANVDLTLTEGFSFTRAIYVGVTGDLEVKMAGGEIVTFVAVPAGQILPLRVSQIRTGGTTALSIVALY